MAVRPRRRGAPLPLADLGATLHAQLEPHRARLLRKVDGPTEDGLRTSVLPSGWSPLERLVHLSAVERRWLQRGFRAEQVLAGPQGR